MQWERGFPLRLKPRCLRPWSARAGENPHGVGGNSGELLAGSTGSLQGLRRRPEHMRAASDFLATKTPGFWCNPWERKWPQQLILNLVQTLAWVELRARFDGTDWGNHSFQPKCREAIHISCCMDSPYVRLPLRFISWLCLVLPDRR